MNLELLMPWLLAASTILSLGTTIYTLMSSGAKTTATQLDAHKTAYAACVEELKSADAAADKRIQKLETEFAYLPDKEVVHRLELTMKDMQVQMATMSASAEATARTARRVEEFLLDQAKAA